MIEFIHIAQAAEVAAESAPKGAVGVLGLNLQLFIAQLVNFAIILLIFWKWVLPAVTKGLQNRTARIEKSLKDAERIESEKKEFDVWKQQEMVKVRTEASEIITKAQTEAIKAKDAVVQQTIEEQQKAVDQAKSQIDQEQQKAIISAKAQLADLVTNATEKILRQKLDEKKDAELIKESIGKIK